MIAPPSSAANDAVLAAVALADTTDIAARVDDLHLALVDTPLSVLETSMSIDDLVAKGRLVHADGLVALAGRNALIERHADAVSRAESLWPEVVPQAERLGRLPLVRMVAVVGPLARGAVADDGSVDVVVAVRPRRLWMTRLMIQLATRRVRRKPKLRPVAIVSTRAMELPLRSAVIASELSTMAVVIGAPAAQTLRRSNAWIDEFLPNDPVEPNLQHLVDFVPSRGQKWIEWFLLLPVFKPFERWTRRRQISQLTRRRPTLDLVNATADDPSLRFSTDLCDEHLTLRAAAREHKWHTTLTN